MQIIIAPAKKMRIDSDSFAPRALPQFLTETRKLLTTMQKLSLTEMQGIWHCSDKLAQTAYTTLRATDLDKTPLTPALMAYVGIQYQTMAPELFTQPALDYAQNNLRILSGFYGILRPFDGIVPYRLEMGSKLPLNGSHSLYHFWGADLYQTLDFTNGPVLNLASKEYSQAIAPYLQPGDRFINVIFGHQENGRVKMRATRAKQARGAMVRYLAENMVGDIAGVQHFNDPHYHYAPELSDDTHLVFLEHD